MTYSEIMEHVQEIFRDIFEREDIILEDTTNAEDIEDWDSLAHIELVTTIEQHFHIRFALAEINGFANVGEMCECISRRISGGQED